MDIHTRYIEKSVIIHRDESGFGFRVGGQNPVIVDCVHENGAAWKAGVRKNDHIIKVNGTLVRSYDHQSVVHMIQNCSPFVNLTLHSLESSPAESQVVPQISSNIQPDIEISTNTIPLSSNANNIINNFTNISSTNNNINSPSVIQPTMTIQSSIHQKFQSDTSDWLSAIEDNLFQDNIQQKQLVNDLNIPNPRQTSGVSKLVETGPNNLISSLSQSSFSGGVRPKIRDNRNQASTRDNPYYYYKTAPEKSNLDSSLCDNADSSHSSQEFNHLVYHTPSSSSSSTTKSLSSIVRSGSKMNTRSSNSAKHKRKLKSRLVGDFRSLTIASTQTNPSSLSTSPSSSDLSDCDDIVLARPEILPSNNSTGFNGESQDSITTSPNPNSQTKSRLTIRRLEIIKELVETEKTHTERLKHLNDLLYKPIKAESLVPVNQLKMVFSCHKSLYKIHRQIYHILLSAQLDISHPIKEPFIGRALVEIFEGELGKRLENAASSFCSCQATNTELLNRFTRKDTKVGEFLAQVANQQMLGRLGIKDLLASCFQRLTKYPLLLDNLLKATQFTPVTSEFMNLDEFYSHERIYLTRALQSSRQILTHVNEAVKKAISRFRLVDLWKKTDKSQSLPVIDIESQPIIHEGPLTLRLNRRTFDVYVYLLTHYLVMLTREAPEKYKLKCFTSEGKSGNQQLSPIFSIDEHSAIRDIATDEKGFYLLCKSKDVPKIYQFASQSPSGKAEWKEKIHMAQQYNYPIIPDDENTLTRYRELISLETSSNTPNNIELHSQTTS